MASNTVSGARTQLENTVDVILDQLGSRSTQKLEHQVEQAGARLGIIQKEIENAVSESVRMQAAGMLQAFEQSLDELARSSVERCRAALAGGLSSLVRSLGDQFQLEPTSNHGREYGRPE
jgi:glutamyl-tRNA reductase